MTGSARTPVYGPEPWKTDQREAWSYWDLWLAVVAVADHGGDLDALAVAIEAGSRSFGASTAEMRLSHLDDVKRRLADVGLDARALAGGADDDPRVLSKARAKVLKQGLSRRDVTDAMRHTPRDRLYARALRGRWDRFPVSPEPVFERPSTDWATGL
jgi:hypothetical protein